MSEQTEIKRYCENCRFFDAQGKTGAAKAFGNCIAPGAKPVSIERYVAPEFDKPPFAQVMRSAAGQCGHNALWFEPKEPTPAVAA